VTTFPTSKGSKTVHKGKKVRSSWVMDSVRKLGCGRDRGPSRARKLGGPKLALTNIRKPRRFAMFDLLLTPSAATFTGCVPRQAQKGRGIRGQTLRPQVVVADAPALSLLCSTSTSPSTWRHNTDTDGDELFRAAHVKSRRDAYKRLVQVAIIRVPRKCERSMNNARTDGTPTAQSLHLLAQSRLEKLRLPKRFWRAPTVLA
jgi:hypothetical protein